MDKKIDGKAVREALKSFWTGQSALFGSLAKVPGTPSEQIAAITKLKDDADSNLAGLPAEDAVVETVQKLMCWCPLPAVCDYRIEKTSCALR